MNTSGSSPLPLSVLLGRLGLDGFRVGLVSTLFWRERRLRRRERREDLPVFANLTLGRAAPNVGCRPQKRVLLGSAHASLEAIGDTPALQVVG